jgi:uncharacterized protein (DUF433 family)
MERKRTPAIARDPETDGGPPVFTGTRIAGTVRFDYLEEGECVDDLVKQYPSVSRHGGACGAVCRPPVARLEWSPARVGRAIRG